MVSYNNPNNNNNNNDHHHHNNNHHNMYHRPQQGVPPVPPPNTSPPGMHPWYTATGYHHQAAAAAAAAAAAQMTVPEQQVWEQQMWHHHGHVPPPHSVFNNSDFPEFMHAGLAMHSENHNPLMPSPTITVSGSELSSPGVENNSGSPQHHVLHHHMLGHQSQVAVRPPPARSPYEWIKKTSYQSQPNPGKTRTKDKYRVVYTDHQRVELEKEFYYSRYITIRRKAELASNLGLSERQVKIWFQNRRAKERKQVKKREEFTPHKDTPLTMGHMTQPSQLIHNNQTQIGQNVMTPQIM